VPLGDDERRADRGENSKDGHYDRGGVVQRLAV